MTLRDSVRRIRLSRELPRPAGFSLAALILVLLLVPAASLNGRAQAPAAADALLALLKSELQRNLDGLKKEPVPPYFASYAVHDVRSTSVRTSFGALVGSDQGRFRNAVVDVRVGSYDLDNTHEIRGEGFGGFAGFSRTPLPLTDEKGENEARVTRGALAGHRSQVQAGLRTPDAGQDEPCRQGAGRAAGARPLTRGAAGLRRRPRPGTSPWISRCGKSAFAASPRRSPSSRACSWLMPR